MKADRVVSVVSALVAATLTGAVRPAHAGVSLGIRADAIADGQMSTKVTGPPFDAEAASGIQSTRAFALRAAFDLGSTISVGVAPRRVHRLESGFHSTARQTDLLALVEAHGELSSRTRIGVFATGGYSLLADEHDTQGPSFGFGARVEHTLGTRNYVGLELGYQLSLESARYVIAIPDRPTREVEENLHVRLYHIGIGAGRRF